MSERFVASNGWSTDGHIIYYPNGGRHAPLTPDGSDILCIEYGRHLERVDSDLVHQIVQAIRRNCTAPFGHTGTTDATIAFVADWIENPPAWVKASWVAQEPPKPWLDAKPGEVWALTYGGAKTAHVLTDRYLVPSKPRFLSDRAAVNVDDPDITAGERIWPRPETSTEGAVR